MRRIVLPLLLLAGVAAAPVASAGPPPLGRVVLRGSSPVAADLVLPSGGVPSDLRVTTSGSYAALLITDTRTGKLEEFALYSRDVDPDQVATPSRPDPLPAGRYRLYLLTDGWSEVSVGLGPSRAVTVLRATRPVPASAAGGALAPVGEIRAPFTATGREYVLFATRSRADLVRADHLETCVTAPGGSCSESSEAYFSSGPEVGGGSVSTTYGALSIGQLRSGARYDFVQEYVGAGTTANGFAVVATL